MEDLKRLLTVVMIAGVAALLFNSCKKTEGCLDPDATNYDSNADKPCATCCEYPSGGNGDNVVKSGLISSDETWKSTKIYELAGKVIVDNGVTLTIEAGTIIKGREGNGTLASALIVAQGGKIMAQGTASSPIIFTSVLDDIDVGEKAGSNLDENDRGKWGGVIILGKAGISAGDGDDVSQIEGIPATETYGAYGGTNDADNSGVFQYVSIRHGGAVIGEGNEINGLTLGGVGTGTTIDHVEVLANVDDGVEFFGGTVDATNILVYYQDDDGLDLDQNYAGTIDNAMVIHGGSGTDEAFEFDGPEGTATDGRFTAQNITCISKDGNGSGADLKSQCQGTITNCVFEGYAANKFIKIRSSFSDTTGCTEKGDAHQYYTAPSGDQTLTITGNEFNTSETAFTDVYTGSCEACGCADALDAAFETAIKTNNSATTSPTKGADETEFDSWTWASIKGKL